MRMLTRKWLYLLGILTACTPADPESTANRPTDAEVAPEGGPLDAAPPSPCQSLDLAAQCPVGSNPRVLTEGCVEGSEITGENGETTGVCAREGECLFICDFQDPCPCGIDAITREGIECTPCSEAAACGDAVCDRGENPQTCAVDCGEICVADAERCLGDARQECDENGRWSTLACRDDQICQFGPAAGLVVTVCQTRISRGGGTFPGFGQQATLVVGDSTAIRFRERSLGRLGLRFIEEGARVLVIENGRLARLDPTGALPIETTNIVVDPRSAYSPTRSARPGRWPQLSDFFADTGRNVEAMVHDGADAVAGGVGLSADDRWLGAAFAVGLRGGTREAVLGIWRTADGQLDRLLRFVDDAVVEGQTPASAVALSPNGEVALEARPGGLLLVWNLAEGRYVHLIQTEVGQVQHIIPSVAGDDQLLVAGDLGAELWALTPMPQRRWRRPGAVQAAALAPDSRAVALGVDGGTVLLDDEGSEITTFATGGALDFDPRGGRLLVGEVIYTEML
jgi:hypothetical protein